VDGSNEDGTISIVDLGAKKGAAKIAAKVRGKPAEVYTGW